MILTKFCRQNYNINNSDSLLIGNISKYQDIENEEIRDSEESYSFVDLKFEIDTPVSTRWLDDILMGIIRFSTEPRRVPNFAIEFISNDNDLLIHRKNENYVDSASGLVRLIYRIPNCFVFCMSIMDDYGSEATFSGYDSRWSVADHQIV